MTRFSRDGLVDTQNHPNALKSDYTIGGRRPSLQSLGPGISFMLPAHHKYTQRKFLPVYIVHAYIGNIEIDES